MPHTASTVLCSLAVALVLLLATTVARPQSRSQVRMAAPHGQSRGVSWPHMSQTLSSGSKLAETTRLAANRLLRDYNKKMLAGAEIGDHHPIPNTPLPECSNKPTTPNAFWNYVKESCLPSILRSLRFHKQELQDLNNTRKEFGNQLFRLLNDIEELIKLLSAEIHSGVEQVQLPEEQVPFPTRTGDPGNWENIVHEHNLLTSFAHEAENIARILRPLRPR